MTSRSLGVTAVTAVTLLLAACGGDGNDEVTGPGGPATGSENGVVEVIAEDIAFSQDSYAAEAGDVEFRYVNEGSIRHTLVVEDVDGFRLDVGTAGDVDEGGVELEPGDYVLFCDVPGHRAAGMEGVLTVS